MGGLSASARIKIALVAQSGHARRFTVVLRPSGVEIRSNSMMSAQAKDMTE
jgi:hypothetical protein